MVLPQHASDPVGDSKPLSGIRILDLTRLIPGNYATMVMAALGADVIKVEDHGPGDYTRLSGHKVAGQGSIHHLVNRGKRSVTLNLKSESDRATFEELVRSSHALLESFRPGTLTKLGYPPQRLHELRPDLVICSISGYGETGPLAAEPAHDINLMAWSGVLDRLRAPGSAEPVLPPLAMADLMAGMSCVMFTLPYISHAQRTGRGVVLDTPMVEAVALLPVTAVADILAGETPAPGAAYRIADGRPGYRLYPTRDGHVGVGAFEDHFLKALMANAGLEDLVERRREPEVQDDIHKGLAQYFAARTTEEIMAAAGDAVGCLMPVQSWEAMLGSDHAKARGFVQQQPFDPMPVLSLPVTVDGGRLTVERGAPRQGEHNREILGRD